MHATAYAQNVPSTRRDLATQAWSALLRAHAGLVPTLDKAVQRTGLSLSWYDVLLELNHAPAKRLRITDLADRVVLSRSRVSRVVDELAAHGYLNKADDPSDRRSTVAEITPEGVRAFRRAAPVYVAAIEDRFAARLSDDELEQLGTLLDKVLPERDEPGDSTR